MSKNPIRNRAVKVLLILGPAVLLPSPRAGSEERVERAIEVAPVWPGHPVGFALATAGGRQFAAFYDADRRLTVASRPLDASAWDFVVLPERVGWDSHCYVAMAVDAEGRVHLAANMHVSPLVYFRTREPYAIRSFERMPGMVGAREESCTYPQFIRGPSGALIFGYRAGVSGNGDQIFNTYDVRRGAWRRLLDQPLLSGRGVMNAYPIGPTLGPDGNFHLAWVWRDTGDAATNHDLSYARSKDLIHWETSDGRALALPMTIETAEVVDPVPSGGGILNTNVAIGFDSRNRPVLTYHKFDARGATQIYDARPEGGVWKVHQVSRWDYRWAFGGGGSIALEIHVGPVQVDPEGRLTQSFGHVKEGSGTWLLDEETLQPRGRVPSRPTVPTALNRVESRFPGMEVHFARDAGTSGEPGVRHVLRWETLGANRDRPRPGPLPPPSPLRLYKLATIPGPP